MIEVGVKTPLTLTFDGPYSNCWGDYSPVMITYSDEVKLYHNGSFFASGSMLFKYQAGGLTVVADNPSTGWDDIRITAIGYPSCCWGNTNSSSSSSQNADGTCTSTIFLTAYKIEIEVAEKPWGNDWKAPEDGGLYVTDSEGRQWYHLWDINENAIRAEVKPEVLANIVRETKFSKISFEPFSPTHVAPATDVKPEWYRIVPNIGLKEEVTASIDVGPENSSTVSLPGTQKKVDIMINGIQTVEWKEVENGAKVEGERVFPEFSLADAMAGKHKNVQIGETAECMYINVEVTLAAAVPKGMHGSVYLRFLDPFNQCVSRYHKTPVGDPVAYRDNGMIDNNGGLFPFLTTLKIIIQGESDAGTLADELYFVYPHLGDNHVAAVHPDKTTINSD